MASMTGKDGDLWKGNIMLNMVVGKWLMIHVNECELQDGPLYDGTL